MEDVKKLLEDLKIDKEILSDETIGKFTVIFESKLGEAKQSQQEKLEEQNKEEIETFKNDMLTQLDEYLNYFVEKFIEDNKESITDSVKVKTAEKVLEKFHGIVDDFNISLSEEELTAEDEINDLKENLNYAVNEKIELEKELTDLRKTNLITEKASSFEVDSEKSSFTKIAENIDYLDDESYKEKLKIIFENINTTKEKETLTEEKLEDKEIKNKQEEPLQESKDKAIHPMKKYLSYLTKD